jgi:hypothetical protein
MGCPPLQIICATAQTGLLDRLRLLTPSHALAPDGRQTKSLSPFKRAEATQRPARQLGGLVDHVVHLNGRNFHGLHLLTPSLCFSPATASPGGAPDAKEDLDQHQICERSQFREYVDVPS